MRGETASAEASLRPVPRIVVVGLLFTASLLARGVEPAQSATEAAPAAPVVSEVKGLPYVYTHWKHYTTKDGLPNDHIFAVKADGSKVWVGTEDGLACIDKKSGKIRSWREKDGLPWKVVTAIDVDKKTGPSGWDSSAAVWLASAVAASITSTNLTVDS